MVAGGYFAAVAVPACDILNLAPLRDSVTFTSDVIFFIFYDLNLLVNRLKRNFSQVCIMWGIILIPNFNTILPQILKLYNI